MNNPNVIAADNCSYRYESKPALNGVSLSFPQGKIGGLLGPNGSGKSTLFKLLTTLIALQEGELEVCGLSVRRQRAEVRQKIGVVFQSPALDKKLTARENLWHQGHLHGLSGSDLDGRIEKWAGHLGVADRLDDIVEKLSGGLQRRVEIAKALLHDPEVLLMDEPSNGLDPLVRMDLWKTLQSLKRDSGKSIILSTHLMEEARQCDHLVLLDAGKNVGSGSPQQMIDALGAVYLRVESETPEQLVQDFSTQLGLKAELEHEHIRLRAADLNEGRDWIGKITDKLGERITSISLAKPTLDDVFVAKAGRSWHDEEKKS